MPRPRGQVAVWSSDAEYPAGPNLWNGTPTKVAPALSKIARGWDPDEMPPAQWLNWFQNQNAAILNYLDGIEVQNWGDVFTLPNLSLAIAYDPVRRLFWAVGGDGADCIVAQSFLGKKWYVDNTYTGHPVSGGFTDVACQQDPSGDQIVIIIGPTSKVFRFRNNAWQSTTTLLGPNVPLARVVWDPYRNKFWIGADYTYSGPNTAGDLIGSTDGGTWTHHQFPRTGTYDGPINYIACSPEYILSIRGSSGGAPVEFSLSDGVSSYDMFVFDGSDGLPTITQDIVGAAYSEADSLFMILTADGKVFTCDPSTIAGTPTWTQASADIGGTPIAANALTCSGSTWLACYLFDHGISSGDRQVLAYSLDQGVTWTELPNPLEEGSSPNYVIVKVGNTGRDGRFYAVSSTISNSFVAFSLRVKP